MELRYILLRKCEDYKSPSLIVESLHELKIKFNCGIPNLSKLRTSVFYSTHCNNANNREY